jgi:outer membrane protein W
MKLNKLASIITLISIFSSFTAHADEGNNNEYSENNYNTNGQAETIYFGYNPLTEFYGGYQYSPNIAFGGKFNSGWFAYEGTGEIFYHRNYIDKNAVPYIGVGLGVSYIDFNSAILNDSTSNISGFKEVFKNLIDESGLSKLNGTNFLAKINAGIEFNFNNNVGLNFGVQYKMLNITQANYPVFHLGLNFKA